MSADGRQDVQDFFNEYVFGFMFSDIEREIRLARSRAGGGNVLAALGLLCYTAVMGGIKRGIFQQGQARKDFEAFYNDLGSAYTAFGKTADVYKVFRSGLVHEYLVKGACDVYMLRRRGMSGIGRKRGGRYYFVVEKYFGDFSKACRRLYRRLMAQQNPVLPPPLQPPSRRAGFKKR
jgi:hypothetical protein